MGQAKQRREEIANLKAATVRDVTNATRALMMDNGYSEEAAKQVIILPKGSAFTFENMDREHEAFRQALIKIGFDWKRFLKEDARAFASFMVVRSGKVHPIVTNFPCMDFPAGETCVNGEALDEFAVVASFYVGLSAFKADTQQKLRTAGLWEDWRCGMLRYSEAGLQATFMPSNQV